MQRTRTLILLTALLTLSLTACGKKEDPGAKKPEANAPESTDSKGAAKTPPKKAEPKKPAAAVADAKVTEILKAMVDKCKVDNKYLSISKCPKQESYALGRALSKGDVDPPKALDTLTSFLVGDDETMRTVAAATLDSAFSSFRKVKKGEIPKDVSQRLLDAVSKADEKIQRRTIAPTVYAASLANNLEPLYKTLDAMPVKLRARGYENVMRYSRLDAFPKIQEIAKATEVDLVKAAVGAPRKMRKPTKSEKEKVCPWGQGFLENAEDKIFRQAGRTMIYCRGTWLDAFLAKGEERNKANTFKRDDIFVYRDVCFSMIRGLLKEPGAKAQCDRNYKLLEDVTNNKKLEPKTRGFAIWSIYYQRRDKETMKLMKKYKKSKVPEIKKGAQDAIDSLVKSYKLKE